MGDTSVRCLHLGAKKSQMNRENRQMKDKGLCNICSLQTNVSYIYDLGLFSLHVRETS